ncbi:hypothetical protein [Halopelagius fulvigenes]|uniref:Uncharacterized protein n=1 Tax=Halopelagius fulvigenes TaxID=1198324 RepID=A0ABD5U3J0_9EURY
MFTTQTGDDIDVLEIGQLTDALTGTGWSSGADPSLVDRDDKIEISVTTGDVRIKGTTVSVDAQSITLPRGDSDWARKDIVYVDENGALDCEIGVPQPPQPKGKKARQARQPSPPDLVGTTGVPIAEIWVPARATGANDLDDPHVEYVRDRRIPVVSDQSITADHGNLSGLSDDDHPQYIPVDGSRKVTREILGNLSVTPYKITPNAVIAQPNLSINVTIEEDGAPNGGDHYYSPVHVPPGATLDVFMVGIAEGDGSPPQNHLTVELTDSDKNQVSGTDAINNIYTTGNPIWSVENTTNSTSVYYITIDNDTSTSYTADGDGPSSVTLTAAYQVF